MALVGVGLVGEPHRQDVAVAEGVERLPLEAELVRVLRRPIQTPPEGPGGGPLAVSIVLDEVRTRLETLPALEESLRRSKLTPEQKADLARVASIDVRVPTAPVLTRR